MYENKEIAARMKNEPEVKKYMKKVMPYIQMVKERYEQIGSRAIDLQSPFDEMNVLNENIGYVTSTLELDGVEVNIFCRLVKCSSKINFIFATEFYENFRSNIQLRAIMLSKKIPILVILRITFTEFPVFILRLVLKMRKFSKMRLNLGG